MVRLQNMSGQVQRTRDDDRMTGRTQARGVHRALNGVMGGYGDAQRRQPRCHFQRIVAILSGYRNKMDGVDMIDKGGDKGDRVLR